jgi:hypothetical protein
MSHPSPATPKQLGFDMGEKASTASYEPARDEVREDLNAILQAARQVTPDAPWDERTFRYNKVVFPQMARWLPEDEAAQLCFEFSREMARIERLRAA